MFKDTILDPAGPISAAQHNLLFLSVGLMLIVIVPVFVLTALIVWRYRAGNTNAKYMPNWENSRLAEIGVWVVPLVIVVFLWFTVWNSTHRLDPYRPIAADQRPLEVQVVALDWQWLFIYPEENVATLNRLVFPAGRPLSLALTSDTVMNSFFIPALGGQIYAMAGMRTELNLMADAPGSFMGRNTQFSGNGFAGQSFTATATDAEDFTKFVAEARAAGATLDATTFGTIARPTANAPVKLFSSVAPNLFESIIQSHGTMPAPPAGSHEGMEAMPANDMAQPSSPTGIPQ